MKRTMSMTRLAAIVAAGALALTGCVGSGGDTGSSEHEKAGDHQQQAGGQQEGHAHQEDGGEPPSGITKASDPRFSVGDEVVLTADHMDGMDGAEATISGAFDTTAYSISYTPTDGGDPVSNHKWVVQEELEDEDGRSLKDSPLKGGSQAVTTADHMPGMKGAEVTVDGSTAETVYMVDVTMDGMTMTNHKWVVESEIEAA